MGRRKIEVQKIEDKNKCVATFRKRRDGLFKKALELHRLTGAEISLTLVYNNARYCFSSHGNINHGHNVLKTFHYNKHFQFKACGSHLPQGCSESNCSPKLSNNSSNHSDQKNEASFASNLKSDYYLSSNTKSNHLPPLDSIDHKKCKSKNTKLTSEERLASLRYLIVDELFKRALTRFRLLTKAPSPRKKESVISPSYSSWSMLSPSSIFPSHKFSSHLINQSEKMLNNKSLSIVPTHTNSSLFESLHQPLQFMYSSSDLSYSSSTDQLPKEFSPSPLSQILEFIDDNINTTTSTVTTTTTTANDDDKVNIHDKKEYLDLDETPQSYFNELLQTPNMICYLDEPVPYYAINDSIEENTH
uniref:SJCHGC05827 protein n=1 Tax=Schistosoma japonicum TaxID=6182 RepID=Q5DDQ8_SCHJA|nr:SJCHGC05827 protein [Schistosoma japonicum]